GEPVMGVVFAPALDRLYAGARDAGATVTDAAGRRRIQVRAVPPQGLSVVASRSHGDAAALDAFLAGRQVADVVNAGSSLKLCLVAAGQADVYPRLGRTMEWDIAAGGRVDRVQGGALTYGKPGFENPHFAAWGGRDSSLPS
ncbi:MAG TPA: inositol monophosphatase family protein, partial [Rubrivivax sp.]|nr:inositol monophosphatase family protein [Rubrivivax sp.]